MTNKQIKYYEDRYGSDLCCPDNEPFLWIILEKLEKMKKENLKLIKTSNLETYDLEMFKTCVKTIDKCLDIGKEIFNSNGKERVNNIKLFFEQVSALVSFKEECGNC